MNYTYAAELERVVDGDTVDLWIDLGFSIWTKQRFRLSYIDAPERFTASGKLATSWVLSQLADKELMVVSEKKDKYGRWLGEIFVKGEELSLNQNMVEIGLAEPYIS